MNTLECEIAGIRSINPFWLASAPPTDKLYNVERAFEAGWGGVVWKTLSDRPVVNVSSRYGAHHDQNRRVVGFNNIELISDRSMQVNLDEIRECRLRWSDRVIIGSLMAPMEQEAWQSMAKATIAAGVQGLELNLGCPHGMCERGMGSAIGQVPELVEQVTRWVKDVSDVPVFTKLTPNITNILWAAEAAAKGGADAVSLINTINSITSIDLDVMAPTPTVDGKGSHGGYCGTAVKPIALNMVAEIAKNEQTRHLAISGIGGISNWRDAAEFIAVGASAVQVCTAAMLYGYKIIDEMKDGLERWLRENEFQSLQEVRGKALPNIVDWNELNMAFDSKARIDPELCIECGRCYAACEDTSHQAIEISSKSDGGRQFTVIDAECVGCNLCWHTCPVEDCITMEQVDDGTQHITWPNHPSNPDRLSKEGVVS